MRRRRNQHPRAFRFFVGVLAVTAWLLFMEAFIRFSYPFSRPLPSLPNPTAANQEKLQKKIEWHQLRLGPFGSTTVESFDP